MEERSSRGFASGGFSCCYWQYIPSMAKARFFHRARTYGLKPVPFSIYSLASRSRLIRNAYEFCYSKYQESAP
jgi:hypothetical protein